MPETLASIDYTANVRVTGGREGTAVSSDGHLNVKLQPNSRLGSEIQGTNPEQLFAAAYGACYQSALLGAAHDRGIDASGSTIDVEVSLGKTASGAFALAVVMHVSLAGADQAIAEELVASAHETCPYSQAVRGNIEVTFDVTTV